MRVIDSQNAAGYLRESGRIGTAEAVEVRELSGGVSNMVLQVVRHDVADGDFVLKQARPQLRVADPWYCGVERIEREVEVLKVIAGLLAGATGFRREGLAIGVPRILFEDRDNHLFAMECIPAHDVWKARLLRGICEPEVAAACGNLLGILHAASWENVAVRQRLGDQQFFDALRIDPYYRQLARVHRELAEPIAQLVQELDAHPLALVHGDFSPKNLLVHGRALTLVDCEVGHFGDPAFDLGFFLTHLFLKSIRAPREISAYWQLIDSFWEAYRVPLQARVGATAWQELESRAARHFIACSFARIDGKSKVEYLSERERELVRDFCFQHLARPPRTWPACRALCLEWTSR